jgi:hypothetical protein
MNDSPREADMEMKKDDPSTSDTSHDEALPDQTKAPLPAAEMAVLMMELARIRKDVEGQKDPRESAGPKGWLMAAILLASLVWSFFGGPCQR